jgi:hypothetical protein
MKSWMTAIMFALALFIGPLTLTLGTSGCSTIGTAAEGTGDVVGGAVEGTGEVIQDTAETAEDELD